MTTLRSERRSGEKVAEKESNQTTAGLPKRLAAILCGLFALMAISGPRAAEMKWSAERYFFRIIHVTPDG
ncbi:MAG: hypothetical protein HQ582_01570, partial [Planctomycetes bacterium]|nr:hypothetical protein [Planctomycetota bacterium]